MKFLVLCLFCLHTSCKANSNTGIDWWKHTIIYEIIPYTYKDSDGDGIGDIKGIISKLDYLKELNIETVYFTPMHKNSGYDLGYDVVDFHSLDPVLGTMDDFDELIRELNKRNMKILIDFVINHSSYKHEWFLKSIDKIDPYTDYYIWKDSKGFNNKTKQEIPPNNWVNVFQLILDRNNPGSAWKWNEKRKQFYFHQFTEQQVDFNLRNQNVVEELKGIIKFWLDKGVAGFRIDAAPYCFEDKDFKDGEFTKVQINQPETYAFFHELRLFLDQYNRIHGGDERIFLIEAHVDRENVLKYYGTEDYPIAHYPFTFDLVYISRDLNAAELNQTIQTWLAKVPKHSVAVWVVEDHDGDRIATRIRPESANMYTIISMLLPGAVHCYYGQEIASINGYVIPGQTRDISGDGTRDPARLIMSWDDSINAGFSTNTTSTYLPPHTDFVSKNIELQQNQEISDYHVFKNLTYLRRSDTIKYGNIKTYVPSKYIFIFKRSYKDQVYYVVNNLSTLPEHLNLNEAIEDFPQFVSVATGSINVGYKIGSKLEFEITSDLIMRPMSSIVLEGKISKH